jgi:hypothetical protein
MRKGLESRVELRIWLAYPEDAMVNPQQIEEASFEEIQNMLSLRHL